MTRAAQKEVPEGWHLEPADGGGFADLFVSPDGLMAFSPTWNRYYRRCFNHDEARRRFASGETPSEIARRFDVNPAAIDFVVQPKKKLRMTQLRDKAQHTACEVCGKRTLVVTHNGRRINDGHAICHVCRAKERRTRVRVAADGAITIRCGTCKTWKPGDQFTRGTDYRDLREGGFHPACKPCQVLMRRNYRARHRVPCEGGCGRMVEGRGRGTRRGDDPNRPYLCQPCWHLQHHHPYLATVDGEVEAVECEGCGAWWDPGDFAPGPRGKKQRPGGFARKCRTCLTS